MPRAATPTTPSPISTSRSRSIRRTRSPTTIAAWRCAAKATTTAPSPTSARRSSSTRTTRSPIYNRGIAYRSRGDLDRSLADLDQSIKLDPKNADAYFERASAYYDKRDYDRAIADLNQAINVKPDYTAAFNVRGMAYNGKGDSDRAIADFDQALRIDPKFAAALSNRGDAYPEEARIRPRHRRFRSGDQGQSELRRRLLQPRPRPSGQARLQAGGRRLHARHQARSEKRRCLQRPRARLCPPERRRTRLPRFRPGHQAQSALGGGLVTIAASRTYERRDLDHAIADLSQAIRLDPRDAIAVHGRGPRLSRTARFRPRHRRFRSGAAARSEIHRRLCRPRQCLSGQRRLRPRHP